MGPLFGVLLAAIFPFRSHISGLLLGSLFSVILVSWFRPELPLILESLDCKTLANIVKASRPGLASEWFFPLNAALTLGCGILAGLIFGSSEGESST